MEGGISSTLQDPSGIYLDRRRGQGVSSWRLMSFDAPRVPPGPFQMEKSYIFTPRSRYQVDSFVLASLVTKKDNGEGGGECFSVGKRIA